MIEVSYNLNLTFLNSYCTCSLPLLRNTLPLAFVTSDSTCFLLLTPPEDFPSQSLLQVPLSLPTHEGFWPFISSCSPFSLIHLTFSFGFSYMWMLLNLSIIQTHLLSPEVYILVPIRCLHSPQALQTQNLQSGT